MTDYDANAAMTRPDWSRVKEVLAAALDQPLDQRGPWLDRTCAGDDALRAEVDALLRADADAGSFIQSPALPDLDGEDRRDEPDWHLGRAIGPYVIERCLGRGGMGAVYLASRADREFERRVAIKMIRRGMDSELVIHRFRHERQILASLDHAHIARLFDGGTTPDGLPYFVMEYVDGLHIDKYADGQRLTTSERLRLSLDVLEAVQHAHDHHVIHRDLKPGNVLVTAEGHTKLLDFGIAKILDPEGPADSTLTSFARPMTPEYASPEQVRGEPVTAATDVYALGVLLYELLTGHRPYRLEGRTPDAIARVVCEQDPERPSTIVTRVETTRHADGSADTTTPESVSVTRDGTPEALRRRLSGPLDAIVMKALRKAPEARYPSVAALAEDIRRWLDERPVGAGRDRLRYGTTRWLRRHRRALSLAALLLVAIAATAIAVNRWTRAGAADPTPAAAATAARPTMAVAGFSNLSGAAADSWLSTALVEMLTTELAGGGQLRVTPAERVARAAQDLGLAPGAGVDEASVIRLRTALGTDSVVVGAFAVSGRETPRPLRIDVRVLRAAAESIAVASVGDEARLFAMVAELGRDLRQRLDLSENTPAATSGARAAFPTSLEATRLFADGLARLRLLDAVEAERRLSAAAKLDPGNPLIQTALASAWTALGYDGRAETAAQLAFDSAGSLTREHRLTVEGRLYEARRDWAKAVDVFRTLWGFFPDNPEYGLRLAAAQTAAGKGTDALGTVEELRRAPGDDGRDPRIDLAEASAASSLGDLARELAATGRARARAVDVGARALVARARLAEGRSLYNQGQSAAAEAALQEARTEFLAVGDRAGAASALNSLATVLSDRGDEIGTARMYEAALATSEQIGDRRGMSAALNNLGIFLKDQNRLDEARTAHERSLALRREINDRNWTAISLNNIGVVLFEQDRLQEATRYYDESLAIARDIGDKRSQIRALHNLAIIDRELGRLGKARKEFEESLAMRVEIGDKRGRVFAGVELGMVLLQMGEIAAARASAEETVKISQEMQYAQAEAQATYQLGEIALASGQLSEARRHHERALALRRKAVETRTILESQLALAALALEERRAPEAERGATEVLAAQGRPAPLAAQAQLIAARARIAMGRLPDAARALAAAERLTRSSQRVSVRSALALVRAELDLAERRLDAARALLVGLGDTLVPAGMRLTDFGRRLLLLRVNRALQPGDPFESDARALARDAEASGAGLIVQRVQALSAGADHD